MNKRNLLAILVGFIASFLLGWLIYGILFKEMYTEGTLAAVNKPDAEYIWWAMMLGNLCWIILFVLLFGRMGVTGFMKGAVNALWIGLLIALCYDLYFWGGTNFYTNNEIVCVDIFVTSLMNAITGGIIGWMLGMGQSTVRSPQPAA